MPIKTCDNPTHNQGAPVVFSTARKTCPMCRQPLKVYDKGEWKAAVAETRERRRAQYRVYKGEELLCAAARVRAQFG